MKASCCLVLLGAVACALAYRVVTDGEREYLLVPVNEIETPVVLREKRQAQFPLVNNDLHRLSGSGSFSDRPTSYGGGLDYTHVPSGTNVHAQAQHTKGFGTDFSAGGSYNILNKPDTQVYIQGQYDRHYGGPWGTGKPSYGIYGGLKHQF